MSKKLTSEYIRMRTKCDRIEGIKNLNLWGCDLEDISIVKDMANLEVVSLSINKIRHLKDFANLKFLRELYIRKNMIGDISEVVYLKKCNNLRTLWLNDNPLADTKNYRYFVIQSLPQVTKLDDVPITNEERNLANNMIFDPPESNEDEDYGQQIINNNNNFKEKNEEFHRNMKESHSDEENKEDGNFFQRDAGFDRPNRVERDEIPVTVNKHFARQHSDNMQGNKGAERFDRHPSQIVKKTEKFEDQDNFVVKKRPKTIVKEHQEDHVVVNKKPTKIVEIPNELPSNNIQKETVINCVMMLINELSIEDVEHIKRELEKKIRNHYDN